jgi:hypothetical protein
LTLFGVLIFAIVLMSAFLVIIAVRGAVLFPAKIVTSGLRESLKKYGLSFFCVVVSAAIVIPNVTAFSWRHLGRVSESQLIETAITYAYGKKEDYETSRNEHFLDYVPTANYFFSYSMSSDEYSYQFWDKVFGDDTYEVMLPNWRVLLDKHGIPFSKMALKPDEQPSRVNNIFGAVVYISFEGEAKPQLLQDWHFEWQRGNAVSSSIKTGCVSFLTNSLIPRVALYSSPSKDFKDLVFAFDASSEGYGLTLVTAKVLANTGLRQIELHRRELTREEFDKLAPCDMH